MYVNDPANASISFGDGAWVGRNCELQVSNSQAIQIGKRASVQDNCKITGDIFIGAYATIAPNCTISSGGHIYNREPEMLIKAQDQIFTEPSKPIYIGEDTWLGASLFIKAGIKIGRGAIIGANSVVTKDVPAYEIWAGVPAKKLGLRLNFIAPAAISASKLSDRVYFYEGFDHENPSEHGLRIQSFRAILALKSSNSTKLHIEVFSVADAELCIKIDHLVQNIKLVKGRNSAQVTAADVFKEEQIVLTPKNLNGAIYVDRAYYA